MRLIMHPGCTRTHTPLRLLSSRGEHQGKVSRRVGRPNAIRDAEHRRCRTLELDQDWADLEKDSEKIIS